MKNPQEYLDYIEQFRESGLKAVKLEPANREDYICFRMAVYCKQFPIEVKHQLKQKHVFLVREDREWPEDEM